MKDHRMSNKILQASAITGGFLWALIPLVDGFIPEYELVLWLVPLLLIGGVFDIHRNYKTHQFEYGLLVGGFGVLFVAAVIALISFLIKGSIAFLLFIGAPATLGIVLVALGTAIMSYRLWEQGVVPFWLALLFGASLPLDPIFNAILIWVLPFGVSLYGVAWVVLSGWFALGHSNSELDRREDLNHHQQ